MIFVIRILVVSDDGDMDVRDGRNVSPLWRRKGNRGRLLAMYVRAKEKQGRLRYV